MKKNFAKLAVLAALTCASSFAEEAKFLVTVPFEFNAAGQTMPAGEYLVAPISFGSPVLLLRGITTRANAMVYTQSDDVKADKAAMVFSNHDAVRTLTAIKGLDKTFSVESTRATGVPLATIAHPKMAAIR